MQYYPVNLTKTAYGFVAEIAGVQGTQVMGDTAQDALLILEEVFREVVVATFLRGERMANPGPISAGQIAIANPFIWVVGREGY